MLASYRAGLSSSTRPVTATLNPRHILLVLNPTKPPPLPSLQAIPPEYRHPTQQLGSNFRLCMVCRQQRWHNVVPPPDPSLSPPSAVLIGYVEYPTQQLTSGVVDITILQNLGALNTSCILPLTSSSNLETVKDMQVRLVQAVYMRWPGT